VDLPEIQAGRVVLRIAQPGMEEPLARFYQDNFAGHLDRWSPPAPAEGFGPAYWAGRLQVFAREFAQGASARFVIQAPGPATGPVIGTCNYSQVVRGPFQACVLGYQIARDHEGKGLMRQALSASLGYAFGTLRLHRVMANYRPENVRSARLLESLGFVKEGYARNYLFIDGEWRDHVLTALSNPDFDPAWMSGARPA
jgi:ribosomal-protein-alanine N-acetyltransferase